MKGNFYKVDHARVLPWSKIFATRKLTRDLFTAANLLVLIAINSLRRQSFRKQTYIEDAPALQRLHRQILNVACSKA